jgi:hypothetical protein
MKKYQDEGWLRTQYCFFGRSLADIVSMTDAKSKSTVRYWLAEHDIERRESSDWHNGSSHEDTTPDPAQDKSAAFMNDVDWRDEQYLRHEVEVKGRTCADLARKHPVSHGTIWKYLDKYDIGDYGDDDDDHCGDTTATESEQNDSGVDWAQLAD